MAPDDQKSEDAKKLAEEAKKLFGVIALMLAVVGLTAIGAWVDSKRPGTPVSVCPQTELEDRLNCWRNQPWTPETEAEIGLVGQKIKERDEAAQKRLEAEQVRQMNELKARCDKIRAKKVVDLTVEDRESSACAASTWGGRAMKNRRWSKTKLNEFLVGQGLKACNSFEAYGRQVCVHPCP
jgi:hypothetical protein